MAKTTFLVTLSVAVEASDKDPSSGPSELQQVMAKLKEAAEAALNHPGRPLGWQSTVTDRQPAS